MADVASPVCPRCGAALPADAVWHRLDAMTGRRPGYAWRHTRPDNDNACFYSDAGPVGGCTDGTDGATLDARDEQPKYAREALAGPPRGR